MATRNPRPRKWADDAEKQRAYRERYAVFQIRVKTETAQTLESICASLDIPRADLVNQLIAFALANRDWHKAATFTKSIVSIPQAHRVATKYQGADDESEN